MYRRRAALAALVLAAALLYVGASAGIAAIAGYRTTLAVLADPHWAWLGASAAGMVVAFLGYRVGYAGIARLPGGPELSRREQTALVAAGFGGFLARGGASLDRRVMEASGADRRQAEVRVAGLGALEHVPIAIGGCIAGIYLLAQGVGRHPPPDFVWPWAVIPPIGGAIAVVAAARYRERLRGRSGLRGKLGVGLDAVWLLIRLGAERPEHGLAFVGMTVFWAGDVFALGAALAAFGYHMPVAPLIIAYVIGYALTRRSAPLGGAGLIEAILPLTLWDSGAPLAVAVCGVFAYRFFNLWLPLPAAFAALPTLRRVSRSASAEPPRRGDQDVQVRHLARIE